MKPKNLIPIILVLGSLVLFSGTPINPIKLSPSSRLDTFPPPQNLWVDTLACIAYWDEPAGDTLPDLYLMTIGQSGYFTDCTYYDIPDFLEYGNEYYIDVWAMYGGTFSAPATDTFTSGYLPIPRNLDAEAWDDVVAVTWEVPLRPDTTFNFSWDIQSHFPVGGTPVEHGIETDGTYIYTTQSSGNMIFMYEETIYLQQFSIPGVSNLKDLAFNPNNELFYGGDGSNICYVMDFTNQTLIETITAPANIHAIAYDDHWDALWVSSWTSDLTLFDLSGNLIMSIPGSSTVFTGLAYDDCTDGGPFLWGFTADYGGADIVCIDILTGEQLYHTDVNEILNMNGSPGGLYTHEGVFGWWAVSLGGCLQDLSIFGLELCYLGAPPPMMVPPNLLGYNLYENEEHVVYIPYTGEDTTTFYDMVNSCLQYEHNYKVHALYDMEPYGLTGDTGESYFNETYIEIWLFLILPFEEYWTSGGFDVNLWDHDDNWTVLGQFGNPEPCAQFQGDLLLNDYSSSLTSWCILTSPGGGYIDGNVLFGFDLKLETLSNNGNEHLYVKIITEGDTVTIDTISNLNGSFDWITLNYDITDIAFNEILRIQFEAAGQQSSEIQGWYLDNIYAYRYCPEPTNLNCTEITPGEYLLTWKAPDYEPPSSINENRDIVGYNIYVDNDYLDFTVDTFYFWHPTASGNLEVGVSTLYEDCESYPVDTVVGVTVGIYEHLVNQLLVYPNPSHDFITIESTLKCKEIVLFNKLGKLVLQQQVAGNRIQVNTSNLDAGVYMVQVVLESGEVISRKVVIYR